MAADATEVTERNSDKAEQAERRGRSPTRRILKRGKPRQGPTPTSNEQRTEEETRGVNKVAGRFRSDASDSIGGATMGAAQDGRKASQSPKRRERDDRRAEVGGVRKEMRKSLRSEGGTRSPSPIKNGRRPPNKGDKTAHQQYMHQYLRKALHIKAEIGMDSEEGKARTEEREEDVHTVDGEDCEDEDREEGSASDDDYQAAEHETRASTGELELERAVNKETSSQIEVPAYEKVGAHPVAEDHTKLTEGRECSSADGQRDGTDEGGRAHSTDGGTH
ncbi:uncharacterized protein KRP23_12110 [Phytophthora ramorum]|uniref:uncharacterized protein n=1 Tax=Phytophthora ramorum TaxID=164328 RepID=UPI0030AF2B51|nr:hypothetical protein KRP23_12110 [Phytophthora ramorum]